MSAPIEDYALVGDQETAAMVGRDGSVDWLCLPRFDSPACLAALLGTEDNGFWRVAPVGGGRCTRRAYRPGTLVLDSLWDTPGGQARVTDFMPPRTRLPSLVRVVEGLSGTVTVRSALRLRFHQGRVVPWVRDLGHCTVAVAGPDAVWLGADGPVRAVPGADTVDWDVTLPHVLPAGADAGLGPLAPARAARAAARPRGDRAQGDRRPLASLGRPLPLPGPVAGRRGAVPRHPQGTHLRAHRRHRRGRDHLAARQHRRGAQLGPPVLLAARLHPRPVLPPALRIPRRGQGLAGLAGAGRRGRPRRPPDRLRRRRPAAPGRDGGPWLPGYAGSRPVRFGNSTAHQSQLDVYGEVLDTLWLSLRAGVPIPGHVWTLVEAFMEHLRRHWREPDHGLWQMPGPGRRFVHSKVMAWVAADRALRMGEALGRNDSAARWRTLRDDVHREVCREGWDPGRRSFVQCYGSSALDASALLIPRLGFLPATDGRVRDTVRAMRSLEHGGFLRRYGEGRTGEGGQDLDGLSGTEGTFVACSLWYADALAATGQPERARELFERVLAVRNDVGLLAEQWDPDAGRQLGNTPQASSHIALVETAFALTSALRA